MIGITEVAFISALGIAVIGPAGMPRVARQAGVAVGQALRFLRQSQAAISTFSQENQISELRGELERGISDVNKIRNEWQSITSGSAFSRALFDPSAASGTAVPSNPAIHPSGIGSTSENPTDLVNAYMPSVDVAKRSVDYSMEDSSHIMPAAAWKDSTHVANSVGQTRSVSEMSSGGGGRFIAASLLARRQAASSKSKCNDISEADS